MYNKKYDLTLLSQKYDDLLKNYTPVQQNTKNKTLQKYFSFFEKLNNGNVHGFFPTNFEKKSAFIGEICRKHQKKIQILSQTVF